MHAFIPGDRVKIADESSQYRNHVGTVLEVPNEYCCVVHLNGQARKSRIPFESQQLKLLPRPGESTVKERPATKKIPNVPDAHDGIIQVFAE